MTIVTFYLLDSLHPSFEQFSCRLVEKAWRGGLSIHMHTANQHQCEKMDQLLWSWREDSFLPHTIISPNQKEQSLVKEPKITIGFEPPRLSNKPLLINLDHNTPSFFTEFSRICEVIVQNQDMKEASREKYRTYQQAGIKPEIHRIGASTH